MKLELENLRCGQRACDHDPQTRVVSASLYNHVVGKQWAVVEHAKNLEDALRNLLEIAHKEVSPRYSPELDDAFSRAEILLHGECDD